MDVEVYVDKGGRIHLLAKEWGGDNEPEALGSPIIHMGDVTEDGLEVPDGWELVGTMFLPLTTT